MHSGKHLLLDELLCDRETGGPNPDSPLALEDTLALVRQERARARAQRRLGIASGVVLVVLASSWALWKRGPAPHEVVAENSPPPPHETIETSAGVWDRLELVATRPLTAADIVQQGEAVEMIGGSRDERHRPRQLSDDDMLALFEGQPAILILEKLSDPRLIVPEVVP